jgi:hypothetical protein
MGILDPADWAGLDEDAQAFWLEWYNEQARSG